MVAKHLVYVKISCKVYYYIKKENVGMSNDK